MKKALFFLLLVCANSLLGQNTISKNISESLNINKDRLDSIAKKLNYKGGEQVKVLTIFTINENGDIVDIEARSEHPAFEREAIRILSELPKMPVADSNGKAISEKYALPLIFVIETEKDKEKRLKKEKRKRKKALKKKSK